MANKLGTNDALDFDVDTIDYGDRSGKRTKTGKNPKRAKKVCASGGCVVGTGGFYWFWGGSVSHAWIDKWPSTGCQVW